MAELKPFPYKGRIMISGPDSSGKSTLFGYQASATEMSRIETKYGSQYISRDNSLVLIGGYVNNEKNNVQYFPPSNDRSILGGISNYDLTIATANDPNFYKTATGNTTNNTNPTDPNQPGTPGTSTPLPSPNQQQKPKAQLLTYPSYIKPDQDRIKFQAVQINTRPQSTETGLQFQFPSPTYTKVGDPVFLAIQAPISDQNSVDWGPDTVNAIDAALYKASSSFMNEGEIQTKISGFMKSLYENVAQNQQEIKKYLAGQAAGINNVLARTDNIVLNPNLELLFQGPQLRPFSFQFKMSARDKDEAEQVRAIIRYFKQNMAVRKEKDLFLKAPYVFTIQYQKGSQNHKGINTISPSDTEKACALTNCSVDYTPLGSYMTYEDEAGTMVAYTLNLQFQELTPIYADDYDSIPSDAIGY